MLPSFTHCSEARAYLGGRITFGISANKVYDGFCTSQGLWLGWVNEVEVATQLLFVTILLHAAVICSRFKCQNFGYASDRRAGDIKIYEFS